MSSPGARRADLVPRGPRRSVVLVAALVALLVAVAGGGFLLLGGDDEPDAAPPAGGAGSSGSADPDDPEGSDEPEAEPDPLDDPFSPESLDLRYRGLAKRVTDGATSCRSAKARKGQRERAVCLVPAGTLELVTYRKPADLEARRERAVTYDPGGVLSVARGGTLMAFEAPKPPRKNRGAKPREGATFLYWDARRGKQSATYLAVAGTDLETLAAAYTATRPVRPYPKELTTPSLVRFSDLWVKPRECMRIATVNQGAAEESYCDVDGPVEVLVGRFRSLEALEAYRQIVLTSSIADEREVRDWSRTPGGPRVGALYEYGAGSGTVARYWDDPECLCYAEAFLQEGSFDRLKEWWTR